MGQLNGLKPWTKEEMMAYLDWSNQEDDRVEARVADQIKKNRLSSTRGVAHVWADIETDRAE